jgi:hypothetical protein
VLRSGNSVAFAGPALAVGAWQLGATDVLRLGMERRASRRCRAAPVVSAEERRRHACVGIAAGGVLADGGGGGHRITQQILALR